MAEASVAWKAQPERGAEFWFRRMLWAARRLGRRRARWLLRPIVGYYLLTAPRARAESRRFLRLALGREPTLRDVARHLHCFASVVLDRLFIMLGRADEFAVDVEEPPGLREVRYGPRGCLLLVAHLGSFEAMRLTASRSGPIKVVLHRGQSRKIVSFFEAVSPEFAGAIIDASTGGAGLVLAVKQALDQGHRVGLMVDRPAAGERTVTVPFFGQPAAFPAGPWLLAAALKVPVVLGFGIYDGGNRYRIQFELFADPLAIPRQQREAALRDCVARYAARLELRARNDPYNWFNFYDFWQQPVARA